MRGGTRAALQVGAVALLPTIAGVLIFGLVVRRVGEAIDAGQQYIEDVVRTEVSHWTQA